MLEFQEIIQEIEQNAKKELIRFGTKKLLGELGFKYKNGYSNEIELYNDTNINLYQNFINSDEFKQLKKRFNDKVNRELKQEIINILETEVIQQTREMVKSSIVENAKTELLTRINSKVYKCYSDHIEQKLLEDLLSDPVFRELKLREI